MMINPSPFGILQQGNRAFAKLVKRALPRSLFGRTLMIVVIPTLLALCIATFVFFDRHWITMTRRLTHAVAGDIGMVVELMRHSSTSATQAEIVQLADRKLDLFITYMPGHKALLGKDRGTSLLKTFLRKALRERVQYPFAIDMKHAPDVLAVQIEVPEGMFVILVPQRRIYTPTTEVFISFMLGSSILLSIITLLFMRNQIRPIRRLAEAAEAIGKGRDVPWFKIEGAIEVRQAAATLLVMRDRLRRMIAQRTAMLAGVSHDLRTPLTRMKLQLAFTPQSPEKEGFAADIAEMETMVEAYLAFAKGEEAELAVKVDVSALLDEIVEKAKRQQTHISFDKPEPVFAVLRPNAFKRCVNNLVSNALRHGKNVVLSLSLAESNLNIEVDDDGPGIPEEKREDVFRPFLRLDESRNSGTGGTGLGLTIARDIARFHGGDIVLSTSKMGGLKARLWLPV